jgi:hypothetical protein
MLVWLIAVVLAVVGIVQLLLGLALLVAAALVGPGGYSIFRGNRA